MENPNNTQNMENEDKSDDLDKSMSEDKEK